MSTNFRLDVYGELLKWPDAEPGPVPKIGNVVLFKTSRGKFRGMVMGVRGECIFVGVAGYTDTVGFHYSHAKVVDQSADGLLQALREIKYTCLTDTRTPTKVFAHILRICIDAGVTEHIRDSSEPTIVSLEDLLKKS